MCKELDELNKSLYEILHKLTITPAEDEITDTLVSNLLKQVARRQILINELVVEHTEDCRSYLQRQFDLTQDFVSKSVVILAERRALLHAASKNKRQINVYKAIDSNR
ncbi:hypothetical protein [Shewanella baltica]|uniref:Flagella biosynthesis chaperone for FliD, FliT n=1 Tax=Shewanella baltica (strain OS195) TaxID=399599 RepID=A9KWQ2_SHEB9|nr:hypothetical protein [Shewanella baltica]ABS09076.1 conserved hypothetical protein [Shewanella baltica OS185]ABX50239.1 conserved hypothetical protein [Shewanella baltica OS195]ADT95232.1 hypothetical protein Sbal678_3085 [Shewanella baltica OS678]EHC06363.1 hypothetical protein Sbal625DRAFT_2041 [Shewanella baltica OS625]KZK65139.1 flagella biosynthesis chaperone for FliD, FliT [Shewanella baltica]